jgi:hypothetical protein
MIFFVLKTDYLIPFSKLVATCAYDKKVHPCLPFTIPCIFLRVYVSFVLSGLGAVYIVRLLQIPPFSCKHKKSRELPGVWRKKKLLLCVFKAHCTYIRVKKTWATSGAALLKGMKPGAK